MLVGGVPLVCERRQVEVPSVERSQVFQELKTPSEDDGAGWTCGPPRKVSQRDKDEDHSDPTKVAGAEQDSGTNAAGARKTKSKEEQRPAALLTNGVGTGERSVDVDEPTPPRHDTQFGTPLGGSFEEWEGDPDTASSEDSRNVGTGTGR